LVCHPIFLNGKNRGKKTPKKINLENDLTKLYIEQNLNILPIDFLIEII